MGVQRPTQSLWLCKGSGPQTRVCAAGFFLWDGFGGPAAGLRAGAGGGLRSGSRNLLSLAGPPSSRPPLPHFLSEMRVRMAPLVPDVNPILPSGLEHSAVTDRDPVSQEHKGDCYTCFRHAGVRPQAMRTALPSRSAAVLSCFPHPTRSTWRLDAAASGAQLLPPRVALPQP